MNRLWRIAFREADEERKAPADQSGTAWCYQYYFATERVEPVTGNIAAI
jgi:hypothetical protein